MKIPTYEEIMKSFEGTLPSDLDTREGTPAYILMSSTAMTMAQLYEELKLVQENAYASTATGEYLDRSAEILGLTRLGKVKAVVRIECENELEIGSVFVYGDLEYVIKEKADGYYLAQCSTPGIIGNEYLGEVLPKENAEIGRAVITKIVVLGTDEEDDDSLRKRFMERAGCPICMGNVSYYKEAIRSVIGAGGIKVVPVTDGGERVRVVITDTDFNEADKELLNYVKEQLDPTENEGKGYGLLPIGHRISVESAEAVEIELDIEINGTRSDNIYFAQARTYLAQRLKELNKTWDINNKLVIKDHLIEDYFFEFDAIRDVNVVSISGQQNRLILNENQIVGRVTINGK